MKTVFHYIDYRAYLRDYYKEKKASTRHFSYRYFCVKAGISSPVFLKLVMDGKSNVSVVMIGKFTNALGLNKTESRYFKHLVLFNQAKSADDKQDHYAVLVSMNNTVSHHVLGREQYEYLSKWYTVVIRELICQYDYNNDYKALAESVIPPISKKDAENAVALLQSLGFIEKQSNGTYRSKNKTIMTNRDIAGPAIRAFNKSMIDYATRSIDTIENTQRNVSGITLGASLECYDILCAEIAAFKDRIAMIVDNCEVCDKVYQLNIQLFPVGSTPKIKRKGM